MKQLIMIFILFLLLIAGCLQSQNSEGLPNSPVLVRVTEQPTIIVLNEDASKNVDTNGNYGAIQSGCGNPKGDLYFQHKPIVDGEIPKCYLGIIEVIGIYSRAELDEIMTFMESSYSGEISRIIVPVEIRNQFYGGEISGLPTNIAQIFYRRGGGKYYLIEKTHDVWQVTNTGDWIE